MYTFEHYNDQRWNLIFHIACQKLLWQPIEIGTNFRNQSSSKKNGDKKWSVLTFVLQIQYSFKKKVVFNRTHLTKYAEARCYPKKRCLGFDFRFKKFRIKQAIFIKDIFPSHEEAPKQKK